MQLILKENSQLRNEVNDKETAVFELAQFYEVIKLIKYFLLI